ncbi:MAG TPA: hypothetical protein VEI07_14490 [Planctomycetaceae bacterium]|nr:hypothetical protein [Planctomycetaceae bacterium]
MRYELKPLGVGSTLDQAILIFKDRLGLFVIILLFLRIPAAAFVQYVALSNLADFPLAPTDAQANEFFTRLTQLYIYVLGPSVLLDFLLISPITNAALIHATARVYLGEPVGVWPALRMALRRYFSFVWTSVLFSLVVGLGTACCILPGILLFFRFALAMTVTVVEPVSGVRALERSRDLMRSSGNTNYLNLFLLLVVLFCIQNGINACSSLIPELHLQVLASALFGSIGFAFASVAQVVFYYSCRCRVEGFDLLQLARIVAETPIEQPLLQAQG